ncbi:hypothetical protein OGV87_09880 [Citrobacter sp. CK183]|uniref:hypothetical protein n=1 Tax=Citrobacter sp. CK183 TaxID=2985092 RepID=UPI0025764707|nr:hypothetical protein [Citrobacter sp. CK183]MDM3050905.1 hypothetical protein [Citrobacter sp. CK183]
MSARDIKMTVNSCIPEASNFFQGRADSVVTVGTNLDGEEVMTLIFMDNYPIVGFEEGVLNITKLEKRKVAMITISQQKAKKFYESLKGIFEEKK